jgi:hypothetical protein
MQQTLSRFNENEEQISLSLSLPRKQITDFKDFHRLNNLFNLYNLV